MKQAIKCNLNCITGPLVVWLVKYLGWAFVTAVGFLHLFLDIMLHPVLPSQMMYFRALPHSVGFIFSIYISLMMLNIMHHVQDCNSVYNWKWEGCWWYPMLFFPHQSQVQGNKTLKLYYYGKGESFSMTISSETEPILVSLRFVTLYATATWIPFQIPLIQQ